MKVRKMKEMLEKVEPEKRKLNVLLNGNDGRYGVISVKQNEDKKRVILFSLLNADELSGEYLPEHVFKGEELLVALQMLPDDADVVTSSGDPVLFVVSYINGPDYIVLEDCHVNDLSSELEARFEAAVEEQMDELDFFMDLLDTGFTLADINKYIPEKYDYSRKFMEEHGLISDAVDGFGNEYDPKDSTRRMKTNEFEWTDGFNRYVLRENNHEMINLIKRGENLGKIDLFYTGVSYDRCYFIVVNDITVGIIYTSNAINSETNEKYVYIEWIEILHSFRGKGILRQVFKGLMQCFNTAYIRFEAEENYIPKYIAVGCKQIGTDDCTGLNIFEYGR